MSSSAFPKARPDIPAGPGKIMIVGESLGAAEQAVGRVFVGPSGQLLDSMLKSAGISRGDCYVTNVFMTRPHNNNVDHFFLKKKEAAENAITSAYPAFGQSGILRPEWNFELERLSREVKEFNPTCVVCLGRTALWAFTGYTSIGAYRGTVLQSPSHPGLRVVATYHPAAVLREWSYRPVAIADLIKAREASEGQGPTPRVNRSIWIADTLNDLHHFEHLFLSMGHKAADGAHPDSGIAGECLSGQNNPPRLGMIAFDVETEGGQITHISLAPSPRRCLVIPFWNKDKPGWHHWNLEDEIEVWCWLHRVLTDKRWSKLGQNVNYDLTYAAHHGIMVRGEIHDTMLLHHSLQPEMEKSLGFLGSLYANELAWKEMRVKPKAAVTKKEE